MKKGTNSETKLKNILIKRSMKQLDLQNLIKIKFPNEPLIGLDRISKIITGKQNNFEIKTAVMISEALEVKILGKLGFPDPYQSSI